MKLINVLYDWEIDDETYDLISSNDLDIISVPDFVCEDLEETVQKFFNWVDSTEEHGYFVIHPKYGRVLSVGTNEFIKWLNDNYFQCENQEAVIVEKFAKYNPDYPSAYF
jgi:hypothetical protein